MSRWSYGSVMSQPAFGLFSAERLVATCRAADAPTARFVFLEHNRRQPEWQLEGDRVRRLLR